MAIWLCLLLKTWPLGFGRLLVNINSVTTVDWLPCFYKLTYEVEKDNFYHSLKVCLCFSITYNSLIYVIATWLFSHNTYSISSDGRETFSVIITFPSIKINDKNTKRFSTSKYPMTLVSIRVFACPEIHSTLCHTLAGLQYIYKRSHATR